MDELPVQIRGEMDREKRNKLCGEVQKIVAEKLPYTPLWHLDQVSVLARD